MFSRKSVSKLILVFSVIFLCFPGVMAQKVGFADPNTVVHKDIGMYGFNSTSSRYELLNTFNTTSTDIELPAGTDVQFVLTPQYGTPLDEPGNWLNGIVSWFATNATTVFLIGVVGFLLFRRS